MRPSQRKPEEIRNINMTRQYTKHPPGSVLVEFGDTKVLCTASVRTGVPRFLKDSNQGWLTAEYGMLPGATHDRGDREAARGKQGGRTIEIQRLIGRSLRACLDLQKLGENTITIDCDVLQADGGTRTAAITGSCVALVDAISYMQQKGMINKNPLKYMIASVSVGVYGDTPVVDLDYPEDSVAGTDMNIVMTDTDEFIEIQGTAEDAPFNIDQLNTMIQLAYDGICQIVRKQREVLNWQASPAQTN